jgi:hypothetical protein
MVAESLLELEGSLPFSQKTVSWFYDEALESNPHSLIRLFMSQFNQ